jgi:hypothetical protein
MNTEVKTTEVTVAEPSQLITLKPEKYVAEVFSPFKLALNKAIREAAKVTYDIATKDGMAKAKEMRALFKKIRLDAESARKERKAPILEIGKLLDTRYRALESEITPHEERFDADIKAEEERIEEEKQRKLAAERARIEAIENSIAQIRNVPLQLADSTSEKIRAEIQVWSEKELNPDDFEEHLEDAINAVNATLVELEKLRVRKVAQEEADAKAAAEREELARLRAEKEEKDRREREEAQAREAAARKDREEVAAREAEQARKIAELEAKLAAATAPKEPEQTAEPINSTGQYYSTTTSRDDGVPILCNADGSRSIFCDVDECAEEPEIQQAKAAQRPTDDQIINVLCVEFGETQEVVIGWLRDMELNEAEPRKAA